MMDEDMLGTRDDVFTVMFMYVCVGGDKGSDLKIYEVYSRNAFSLGEKYDVCSNT